MLVEVPACKRDPVTIKDAEVWAAFTVVKACNTESTLRVEEPEAIVKARTEFKSALVGKATDIFLYPLAAAEAE